MLANFLEQEHESLNTHLAQLHFQFQVQGRTNYRRQSSKPWAYFGYNKSFFIVTDIFRGDLISSDSLYGRSILTTTSSTTAYGISPTTTYVSVETGSTSVISPTTHRGHEFTWGESFLYPRLYKYPWSMNKQIPWVHSIPLCSRTLAFYS